MSSLDAEASVNHKEEETSRQVSHCGIATIPEDDRQEHVFPVRGQGAWPPAGSCWLLPLKATKRSEVINKQ